MKRNLPVIIVFVLALVGLIDSTLIHLKEIASVTDVNAFKACSLSAFLDCGQVAKSHFSHIFGMPVSLFGIYFYSAMLGIGFALLNGWKPTRTILWLLTAAIGVGVLFSIWLFFISYFGIGALCIYCLVSDTATLLMFVAWAWFMKSNTRHATI